jgi:hypothetical protein
MIGRLTRWMRRSDQTRRSTPAPLDWTLISATLEELDWTVISATLEELETVLAEDHDGAGAKTIAGLRADVAAGGYSSVLARLTSGEMWNHMGSFFDRQLSTSELDRRFQLALIQLADTLEAAGAASTDVSQMAAMLRTIQRGHTMTEEGS